MAATHLYRAWAWLRLRCQGCRAGSLPRRQGIRAFSGGGGCISCSLLSGLLLCLHPSDALLLLPGTGKLRRPRLVCRQRGLVLGILLSPDQSVVVLNDSGAHTISQR